MRYKTDIEQNRIIYNTMEKRKKTTVSTSTVTRDLHEFSAKTGNLYESVTVMAKRANQLSAELREDIEQKLMEFNTYTESTEEIQENREQIELSKYYERLPKTVLVAAKELENDELIVRDPLTELDEKE